MMECGVLIHPDFLPRVVVAEYTMVSGVFLPFVTVDIGGPPRPSMGMHGTDILTTRSQASSGTPRIQIMDSVSVA